MEPKGTYTVKFYLDTDLESDAFRELLHQALEKSDLPCQMWVTI